MGSVLNWGWVQGFYSCLCPVVIVTVMSPECSVSAFQVKIKMRFEETQIANVKLIPKLPCPGPTAPPGP